MNALRKLSEVALEARASAQQPLAALLAQKAVAHLTAGETEPAQTLAACALKEALASGNPLLELQVQLNRVPILLATGARSDADEALSRARALAREHHRDAPGAVEQLEAMKKAMEHQLGESAGT